jgi:hypothetical protein
MTEERGLSPRTLKTRRWHLRRFLDWLHERHAPVPGLSPRDRRLSPAHGAALSASRSSHTNAAVRSSAAERADGAPRTRGTLHGPHIYRDNGLPIGPSWDDVNRLIRTRRPMTRRTSETVRFSCCSPSMASGPVRSPRWAWTTSIGSTTV